MKLWFYREQGREGIVVCGPHLCQLQEHADAHGIVFTRQPIPEGMCLPCVFCATGYFYKNVDLKLM